MTGREAYESLVGELSEISGYPIQVSPHHYMKVLNAVMETVHDKVSIYHRWCKFTWPVTERYGLWPGSEPEPLKILSASYHERNLTIAAPLQYPGPVDSDEDWPPTYDEPKFLWLERRASGFTGANYSVRIGIDPIPPTGLTCKIHCRMSVPLPAYTNWETELPPVGEAHQVILDGVLAKFYDMGKTFHENQQKQMHYAAYIQGIESLKPLVQRNERQAAPWASRSRYTSAQL